MTLKETAFTFAHDHMVGIIHYPANYMTKTGLLIVVGGPQYRIGAHRQYVHLARHCASRGIAVMRFDYRGVGDSDGCYHGFEHVGMDIEDAIKAFLERCPDITTVAIWGLCEGASAILLGGTQHKAVSHIILANPWVRSETGLARAYVKHYYMNRLKDPEFWHKIFSGHLDIKSTISGLFSNIRRAFGFTSEKDESPSLEEIKPFPDRMLFGLQNFQGKSLLIMSEQDLVAREFDDLISSDKAWQKAIRDKISNRVDIADTDHTFSTEDWRGRVATSTADWLVSRQ